MAYPDESRWPYEPNARLATKRVDWFSVPDESFLRATPARIRSLDEADARRLYTDDRLGHRREQLPDDARNALDMMMTGAVAAAPTKVNKAELRGRLESELETVKSQAEADGNVSGQLQAIKLHAELLALLNEKEAKIDPVVNIYVVSGVER
jgi:hypothetical protein